MGKKVRNGKTPECCLRRDPFASNQRQAPLGYQSTLAHLGWVSNREHSVYLIYLI